MPRSARHLALPKVVYAGRFAGRHDCTLHSHGDPELVWIIEGHCTLAAAGNKIECFPGDLCILPAGVAHMQRNRRFTRNIYVIFQWKAFSPSAAIRKFDLAGQPCIGRWLDDICNLWESSPTPPVDAAGGLLLAALRCLAESNSPRSKNLHPAVARALRAIDSEVTAHLSLEQLAERAGISASRLSTLFRSATGVAPMHYQQDRRMELARRLLADPYRTVREVGQSCGYNDANYFVRLFGKRHGCSPAAFRRRMLPGK